MRASSRAGRVAGAAAILGAAGLLSLLAATASDRSAASIGLRQSVYDNTDFNGPPILERQDADFDVEAFVSRPDVPGRYMAIRWEGYWFLPRGGPVRFHATADDAVQVWIDDRLMAHWQVDGGYQLQETVEFGPGLHRIRIEHVQYGGGAALGLEWGQPDYPLRRFVSERLFPEEPTEGVIVAAARARTLRAIQPVVWSVSITVAFLLLALPPAAGALGRIRRADSYRGVAAIASDERYQVAAANAAGLAMVAWAVGGRLGALGPVTFWNDDIWVVALASQPSPVEALSVPAPVPPGFVLLEWIARWMSAAPGASLQIVPLASALLAGAVAGWLAARLTGSRMAGLATLGLSLLDPLMAQFSVFTKQYTLDALVTVGLLGLAVRAAERRPLPLGTVATLSVAAVFLSFPSVFASAALVHALALGELAGGLRTQRARRAIRTVVRFDLVLAGVVWFLLLGRSGSALERGWWRSLVPTGSVEAGMDFMAARGTSLVSRPFGDWAAAGTLLAGLGLVWLLVDRRWRSVGLFVAGTYACLLAAATLGLYPLAAGFQGRVLLFTHGLAAVLAGVGVAAVSRALGVRVLLPAAAAAVMSWHLSTSPPEVSYFDHDHARIVEELARTATDDDAIVVTAIASYGVAVYGRWPAEVVRNRFATGFHMRILRPLTVTVPFGTERDRVLIQELEPMLRAARPPRVFFFSQRRSTTVIEALIERAGYKTASRRTSTTETLLATFERRPADAGSAAEPGGHELHR